MKKKNSWDYQKTKNKAPGPPLGSRLVHTLLITGCCVAATISFLCLTLYIFSTPLTSSGQSLKEWIGLTSSVEESGMEETAGSPETDRSSPGETSISEKETFSQLPALLESDSPPSSEAAETEVPMLVYSGEQGNISGIGEQQEQDLTNDDYLVMLDTAMGTMLYYNQGDDRWGDYLYGGADPIRYYGCGPTVAAMLVNAFTNEAVTPKEMADWCSENRCHAPQSGSYHSIFNKTLPAFGLQVESAAGADYDTAAELLRTGHVLVALMGKGEFTNGGHFIIITNILENGNVSIADCNSLANTTMEWDLNQVLDELSRARDSGSPLWAVSFPAESE